MTLFLLFFPLAACVAGDKGDTSDTTDTAGTGDWVLVDSCVIAMGQSPEDISYADEGGGASLSHEFSGTVREVGSGAPSEGCTRFETWRSDGTSDATDAWWFVVSDITEQFWTVGVQELGDDAAPEVGETVTVTWAWQEEVPFAGQAGSTELDVEDFEGAPIAWVGVGAGLSVFDPPREVSLSVGAEIGRETLECYTEVAYELDASAEGNSASLGFGEAASLGRYTVVHGGTVDAVDPTCSETMGSETRVGVRR